MTIDKVCNRGMRRTGHGFLGAGRASVALLAVSVCLAAHASGQRLPVSMLPVLGSVTASPEAAPIAARGAASAGLPDAPRPAMDVADAADSLSGSSSSAYPGAGSGLTEAGAMSSMASGRAMGQTSAAMTPASQTDKYILPGQHAPSITVKDKVIMGIKDAVSPLSAIGWLASAGYEQVLDGSPNYLPYSGTSNQVSTGKQFAQRLGSSAARATSEGIFGDSILSPLFHEDPRYYQMGSGHSFGKRLVYAGTRALITRTDSGKATPNFGQIGGNLAGAFLTDAYYPELNRSTSETLKTFGGSVGGSALGFVVSEFFSNTLSFLHLSDNK